jgi:RHS repeat-associated protein
VGSTSYGYDDNGNMTSRGSDTFEYDHENRLIESVIGSTTSTSTYNGDGIRVSHTVGATTTNYLWDYNRSIPEMVNDGTNTYVYGAGTGPAMSVDGSGAESYYMGDGLGSKTDILDQSRTDNDTYSYDAFGAPTHVTGSSANPFQFTGQQTDSDSGLQYLRARYYDPATGRFPSRDPRLGTTRSPQSLNRYTYSWNNPTSLTDPSGLSPSKEGGPVLTFTWQAGDNPYLFVNRILSAMMPRLDDACLRDPVCVQASHATLTALAPVATSLSDLLRELLQAKSCGEALGDIFVGAGLVRVSLLMFGAAAGGPVLWLGAGALAFGGGLLVRGWYGYANNCSDLGLP